MLRYQWSVNSQLFAIVDTLHGGEHRLVQLFSNHQPNTNIIFAKKQSHPPQLSVSQQMEGSTRLQHLSSCSYHQTTTFKQSPRKILAFVLHLIAIRKPSTTTFAYAAILTSSLCCNCWHIARWTRTTPSWSGIITIVQTSASLEGKNSLISFKFQSAQLEGST